ncbi:hypothetical protein [Falsiroseomonas sp. E2-1-a4]|uniref:hypothetical protein n=1 Tax=Falsiroseomonas sp. E2-1-a4 TaxID=3239299 RepID=UPI003F33C05B
MYDHHAHFEALHSMISESNPDLAVTFKLKRGMDFSSLQSSFELFMNLMQREVDGRQWSSMPEGDRPAAIGLVQIPIPNPHMLVSFYAPQRYVDFLMSPAARVFWKSCHPRCGQLDAGAFKDARRFTAFQLRKASGVDGQNSMVVYLPEVLLREPAPKTDQRPELAPKLVSFRARGAVPAGRALR